MKFIIHTKETTFLSELLEDTPDGVTIIDGGKNEVCFDDVNASIDVSININVTIDVTKITLILVIAWLVEKAHSRHRTSYINIKVNNKEFPINNPDTVKLIDKEINDKQNNK
ncbi:hypothetical protein SAMN05216326_12532 [Nitrosomonas marina]|uniref:Uncharacterized protein n=1 Tax=Nitrosomonas marina TaxID=917 RepID=A0A1I0E8A3_9PROT|nr:hypothetical protein [Nitrosomonas marina]SET40680.1 hypothetical protein SAMN05216326_12532 [Nitrosomonas marina]